MADTALSPLPSVALHRVEAVGFELACGAEEMGVVGHVEHAHVPHRPNADLLIAGAVDEDGMALVDATGDVGVAARAEDGGGAGVGVDAGEVGGARGKQRSGSWTVAVSCRKKAHSVSAKRRSSPPKMRAQNLNEA